MIRMYRIIHSVYDDGGNVLKEEALIVPEEWLGDYNFEAAEYIGDMAPDCSIVFDNGSEQQELEITHEKRDDNIINLFKRELKDE